MKPWPNDNWTRVEVFRLVYGHLPNHTGDTITRKTIKQFRDGVVAGKIKSETIDPEEIAEEMKAGRFLISAKMKYPTRQQCRSGCYRKRP